MTAHVTSLFRYPIKSLGRERIDEVTLVAGQTMPWDRKWAVMHEHSKTDGTEWARCLNFLRVASSPQLAAVTAELDEASATVTLRHPSRPDISVRPDENPNAIVDWAAPLVDRSAPTDLAQADRGMTDSAFASVSVANMSSHRAVAQKSGTDLSMHRWRSNIWLDGLGPWEEFEWVDREVQIGGARLRVIQRTDRCLNVLANPETGKRDVDVLKVLESWGHQDFSVLAEVTEGGPIRVGDEARAL